MSELRIGGGYRVAALWTLAVALLLLAPLPESLRGISGGGAAPIDKLVHCALFMLLAGAWFRAMRPPAAASSWYVALAVTAFGGLLELAQPQLASRTTEWGDFGADATGVAVAWLWSARSAASPARPEAGRGGEGE